MINDATKQKWFEQVKADYPNLHPDMINTILDLYQTDKGYIEKMIKDLKKGHKGPLEVKNKLTLEELEKLNEIGLKQQEEIQRSFSGGVIINKEIS